MFWHLPNFDGKHPEHRFPDLEQEQFLQIPPLLHLQQTGFVFGGIAITNALIKRIKNHFFQSGPPFSAPLCTLDYCPPLYTTLLPPSVHWTTAPLCTLHYCPPLYTTLLPPSVHWTTAPLCTLHYCPPLYTGLLLLTLSTISSRTDVWISEV